MTLFCQTFKHYFYSYSLYYKTDLSFLPCIVCYTVCKSYYTQERVIWSSEWADVCVTTFLKKYFILLLDEANLCWFSLSARLSVLLPKQFCFQSSLRLVSFFIFLVKAEEEITSCYAPTDHQQKCLFLVIQLC